jgi:membrane-bound lytic murein transglycosylase A
MARRKRPFVPLVLAVLIPLTIVAGWYAWRTLRNVAVRPPAGVTLALVRFAELPGWKNSNPEAALQAFARSCIKLAAKPASEPMGADGYAGIAADWRGACRGAGRESGSAATARSFFEANFLPVEVTSATEAPLFTGYYEPELFVSRTRHDAYNAPIYGLPANLISVELGLFRPQLEGEKLEGCVDSHKLLPCPARADIDAHGMAEAPVLFFANDQVSVFFLHIQGSGRVRLDDGTMVRVSYAGQNGRPYKPIGRTLVENGWLGRAGMSMQAIRNWLKAHPDKAGAVMESDPSYVFFREAPLDNPALGSIGSEGVPLTPAASLAVDAHVHPLGLPVYVAAMRPDPDPRRPEHAFNQLLIAQDTGGAIRGTTRGDVFWGFGATAEAIAGRMKSSGRFFVLLPKAVASRLRRKTVLTVS